MSKTKLSQQSSHHPLTRPKGPPEAIFCAPPGGEAELRDDAGGHRASEHPGVDHSTLSVLWGCRPSPPRLQALRANLPIP
jgi:hypothetical protein